MVGNYGMMNELTLKSYLFEFAEMIFFFALRNHILFASVLVGDVTDRTLDKLLTPKMESSKHRKRNKFRKDLYLTCSFSETLSSTSR